MKDVETTRMLLGLLAEKHAKDIFVSECKTGSTFGGCPRLDAWVMIPSWAHPLVIGYEIKASKHDFLNDEKWRSYLPYCNEFYFVCPTKIISPEEMSDGIGLLWSSTGNTRLYRKKKAKYRDVTIPEDIFRYILMSRAVIGRYEFASKTISQREYWQAWLRQKKEDVVVGYKVSKKIQEVVAEKITCVETENEHLVKRMQSYDDIIKVIKLLGEDPKNSYWVSHRIKEKIKKLQEIIPNDLLYTLKNMIEKLSVFEKMLKEHKNL